MEEDRISCSSCGTSYNKMFLMGKQGNVDVCPMCGKSLLGDEENRIIKHQKEKTKYYYYKEGGGMLDNTLSSHFTPIYIFEATDIEDAERQLKKVLPNSPLFAGETSSKINCPWCGSSEYTMLNKGYSIFTGFLGSGNVKRVCNRCKKEF